MRLSVGSSYVAPCASQIRCAPPSACLALMNVEAMSPRTLATWVAGLPQTVRARLLAAILAFEAGNSGSHSATSSGSGRHPPPPVPIQDRRRCTEMCPDAGEGFRFCLGVCNRKMRPNRRRPQRRHWCRPCHNHGYGEASDSDA